MAESKPEHPAVKNATVIGGVIFVTVVMVVFFAKEHLAHVGWIVVPLVVMAIALAGMASKKSD